GSAPVSAATSGTTQLQATIVSRAIAAKRKMARALMQQHPAFFGVGVGQSLDDPRQAALVVYVDRDRMPAELPETIGGMRTRYVIMHSRHVTRSYAAAFPAVHHCIPHGAGSGAE